MELLQTADDTTEVLASYNHRWWNSYAAVTFHPYGEGSTAYIGCYFDSSTLEQLLNTLCDKMNIQKSSYHFPLIIKEGINENGDFIQYLLNYSNDPITYEVCDKNVTHVFENRLLHEGESLILAPWDVIILLKKQV